MVGPDTQTDEHDANRSCDHGGITEDRFSAEYRNDFVGNRKCGQDEDVHFWMSEYPEEMNPDQRRSPSLGVEEVTAQIAIDEEHELRRSQWSDGDQRQHAYDEHEPGK